jgi:hypothetical protein
VAYVEGTTSGRPQPTKSSGLDTTGPPYSLTSAEGSELVSNVKDFQESNSSSPCLYNPVVVSGPFQQWGLDFIGEIHPASSGQHRWILTATDFFTKWIEAIPTRSASHKVIIGFLEDLITRFGCPRKIVTDNATSFKAEPLVKFCEKFRIKLIHSTPYYPQGNGLAESSNKSLIRIIKRLLEDNKKAWNSKMKFSLWADRVTTKRSIGISPFQLVYGAEAIFPFSAGHSRSEILPGSSGGA